MAIPNETKKGFYFVAGILAALYVGSLILRRLPG
jgi:hypothetical protein